VKKKKRKKSEIIRMGAPDKTCVNLYGSHQRKTLYQIYSLKTVYWVPRHWIIFW